MPTTAPAHTRHFWRQRDFWYAELAARGAAGLFFLATPGMTRSDDVYTFEFFGKTLIAGGNPYVTTPFMAWPPFWMLVTYALEKISAITGIPYIKCHLFTVLVIELVVIAALYIFLQAFQPEKSPRRFVLWVISLNPICILLTCQHGNFDGLIAASILFFLTAFVCYQRDHESADWLLACLLLGIGILIKTTPFVLVPLLFLGISRLRLRTVFLGGALAVGPVSLGMSIIYVLAPAGVTQHVLAYRSYARYFGITGILGLMDLSTVISIYTRIFPILLLTLMLALAYGLCRATVKPERLIILIAAGAMLGVPLFGPGYAPQYLFWSVPLLAAVYYVTHDLVLRRVFLVAYVITAIDYIVEYSFFGSHGALAVQIWSKSEALRSFASMISTEGGQTLVRLPLFIALLAVFGMLVREAKRTTSVAA